MLRHPLTSFTAMPSSSSPNKPRKPHPNGGVGVGGGGGNNSFSTYSYSPCCKHSSPSATLDLLILLLVLFSCTFLITSSFSYICQSLSQILPSLLLPLSDSFYDSPIPYAAGLLLFLAASLLLAAEVSCGGGRGGGAGRRGRRSSWFLWWSRGCGNPRCKGLRKATEFDVQLQTEDCLKSPASSPEAAAWKEIDGLPWKGGEQGNNPDYECLRVELRKMAPPNGRAVLLFRARCGCPIAKLEAWGPKRGRKHKKGTASLALEGGD